MSCKDTRKGFFPLLDGDLSLTERAPLEVHLDQCIKCWAELEKLRRTSAPLRAIWRARLALDSLRGVLDTVSPVAVVKRLRWRSVSGAPSKVLPVAVVVTVVVVLAAFGIQRRTELVTQAPEAAPVRETSPRPASLPLPAPEPARQTETPSLAPSTTPEPAEASVTRSKAELPRVPRDRSRTRPIAKLRGAAPDPGQSAVTTIAPKSPARPGTPWVLGSTKDEEGVLPDTENVRRDRD